jgi:hypothetical protein
MSSVTTTTTTKSSSAKFQLPFVSGTQLVPLGDYVHIDTGTTYTVVGHSLDVESKSREARVLYRNAELANGQMWARPIHGAKGFLTHVTYKTPSTSGHTEGPRFVAKQYS